MTDPLDAIAEQRQTIAVGTLFAGPAGVLPRYNSVLGVGHQAQNPPGRVRDTGNP